MKTLKTTFMALIFMNLLMHYQPIQAQEEPQLVSTEVARTEELKAVTWLSGNVINRLDANISAEQTGQLLYIVEMGSQVKKGVVIARLDDRALVLELSQLQAQHRQLKANVEFLKKQQVRMDKLAKNYSTAVSEIDRNRRDLEVAKEQLAAMSVQIKRIELNVEHTQIKAPFDGIVNAHFVGLGELIAINTPLLQLVDAEHLDIQVATPLDLSGYIAEIEQVQVKWADQLVVLPVRTWSVAGHQSSRTFDLRIDASGIKLFAGSAVQVLVPKSEAMTGVTIPRDGLILREKESYVFKVDEQKIAHKVTVQIGQGIDDWVMIKGDINAGDQIIVRGGERLQDGQSVRVSNSVVELNKSSTNLGLTDAG